MLESGQLRRVQAAIAMNRTAKHDDSRVILKPRVFSGAAKDLAQSISLMSSRPKRSAVEGPAFCLIGRVALAFGGR
jgi:hypothetical protein